MPKYSINGSTLTGIADAVRDLDENNTTMTPAQMGTRVAAVASNWKAKVAAAYGTLGIEAYDYDNTATYAVGDYCVYEDVLYTCRSQISTAEEWTAAHWTAVDVISKLKGHDASSAWQKGTGTDSAKLPISGNTASGYGSVAEGSGTTASGALSHAEGSSTNANSVAGHAEGLNTTVRATANGGHAEGSGSIAGAASGTATAGQHAEGIGTLATGAGSHAEGISTEAGGTSASHAEGSGTKSTGESSHAEGTGTKALGNGSHAEGGGTQAQAIYSHAEGNTTQTRGDNSHAEGYGSIVYSTAPNGHAEGRNSVAGNPNGQTSFSSSHAEGENTASFGLGSHSEGNGTIAQAEASHAEGSGSNASGDYGHAEGFSSRAAGVASHAEGFGSDASGNYSHAQNEGTYALGKAQTVIGRFNVAEGTNTVVDKLLIVGNGTGNNARSNALTLDNNGNLVLSGKATVGATPTSNMDVTTKQYVDSADNSVRTIIASAYDSTATYSVGDIVLYNTYLYKCTSDITTPELWDASHWLSINIVDALTARISALIDDTAGDGDTGKVWSADKVHDELAGKVGFTDYATYNTGGVVKANSSYGLSITSSGRIQPSKSTSEQVRDGENQFKPIVPYNQHESTFYGLAKAAGDSTQSASNNAVGIYTDDAKIKIQKMLGIYEAPWELIYEDTTTEDLEILSVTVDSNGEPFELSEMYTRVMLPPPTTGTQDYVKGKTYVKVFNNDTPVWGSLTTLKFTSTTGTTYFEYKHEIICGICRMESRNAVSANNSQNLLNSAFYDINETQQIQSINGIRLEKYSSSTSSIPSGTKIQIYGRRKWQ